MIYIYDDGIHSNAHVQTAVGLVTKIPAAFCTPSMIIDGCLNHAKIIIMPGGADVFICEKMNGQGNQIIRDFVANGGSYLGICAGAYYGCSSLDWNHGEIDGKRELALTNALATGPIYDFIENTKSIYQDTWIKAVEIKTSNGNKFLTQYNGGPVFGDGDYTVIARYRDLDSNPPAIIGGQYGEGNYILSSPHIESFGHFLTDRLYKHLNHSYDREKIEIDKLLEHEDAQKDFFKNIIDHLL